ncbi:MULTISPECIES: cation:proton antiporter [unclassified Methanoculleus]|uniref:Cation:proton antiporter n=1 Tax=Methanoculleus palmolei TaxID=72612 RepID=A0ABD8A9L6_9EURY|nr:cation:proton antiporter [Methanoculleus sp. UBA377]MDD2472624.1 cation:proton antiporter [Methanoculleus sp.]WOX55835.1 cation:proton antiporter [Methanoculleus palmolei]
MIDIFHAGAIVLILTIFLCLYRVLAGPGVENRLIAVNTIGTKTIILLVLIGFIYERPLFVDIAIVYAMINFIATLAIAKYLGRGCIC